MDRAIPTPRTRRADASPLVDRDPELRGVAAAERLDEPPSGRSGRSPFRWLP